jgi:hypothetical protein
LSDQGKDGQCSTASSSRMTAAASLLTKVNDLIALDL